MSINIVNPAPNVKPFVGIERANGYNSGVANVWNSGYRVFNSGYVRLYASGTDFTLVDKWGDDIAPSLTYTQITGLFNGTLSNVYDKNESTYAQWSIAASSSADLFSFDLGAQKPVFVYIVVSSGGGSYVTFYIYGSNDNSTWTQLGSLNTTNINQIYTLLVYGNYRYFKVSANNTDTGSHSANVYEVEVWNPGNTLKTFTSTTTTNLFALINNACYQVLEVIYP
jgi:hypothetical protein